MHLWHHLHLIMTLTKASATYVCHHFYIQQQPCLTGTQKIREFLLLILSGEICMRKAITSLIDGQRKNLLLPILQQGLSLVIILLYPAGKQFLGRMVANWLKIIPTNLILEVTGGQWVQWHSEEPFRNGTHGPCGEELDRKNKNVYA